MAAGPVFDGRIIRPTTGERDFLLELLDEPERDKDVEENTDSVVFDSNEPAPVGLFGLGNAGEPTEREIPRRNLPALSADRR